MAEHSGDSYDEVAAKYADMIDEKPFTRFFERPSYNSLLPDVAGKTVLDVGSGSGWYTARFLEQGAAVTAMDYNAEFVARTRARVGERAMVVQANLAEPLGFAQNAQFDLVSAPLVMHYIKDWLPVFQEFWRVLKQNGRLVFSTHHSFTDWQQFDKDDYFAIERLEDTRDVGTVSFYRRPLTQMCADLAAAGFVIERLLEPQPLPELRKHRPDTYERLMKQPWRLLFRAKKA